MQGAQILIVPVGNWDTWSLEAWQGGRTPRKSPVPSDPFPWQCLPPAIGADVGHPPTQNGASKPALFGCSDLTGKPDHSCMHFMRSIKWVGWGIISDPPPHGCWRILFLSLSGLSVLLIQKFSGNCNWILQLMNFRMILQELLETEVGSCYNVGGRGPGLDSCCLCLHPCPDIGFLRYLRLIILVFQMDLMISILISS